MAPRVTHNIDPEGDMVVVLKNANAPFAELDEADKHPKGKQRPCPMPRSLRAWNR